jgi:hypothetical protein
MRVFMAFAIVAVALGYVTKSTRFPSSTMASLLTAAAQLLCRHTKSI